MNIRYRSGPFASSVISIARQVISIARLRTECVLTLQRSLRYPVREQAVDPLGLTGLFSCTATGLNNVLLM